MPKSARITRNSTSIRQFDPLILLGYATPPEIRRVVDSRWEEEPGPSSIRRAGPAAPPPPESEAPVYTRRAQPLVPYPNGMPFAPGDAEPVYFDGESHLITIAPTGAGKGVGPITTNLLTYPGAMVVIDPKGENYAVTAARRRAMGHLVVALDPFAASEAAARDCFNPLQYLWDVPGQTIEDEAHAIAGIIAWERAISKEPFWDNSASALIAALILYIVTILKPEERHLGKLYELLHGDDVVYNLAVILDTVGKKMNQVAYREIAAFLQAPDVTRGGILSTAQQYLKKFSSAVMQSALSSTSFSLKDLLDGAPITIYLILPPDKLQSHANVLRLWVNALLKTILSRKQRPAIDTLLILDEAAQLGYLPSLETAMTLCRGYGLKAWSFWQSPQQLQQLYPYSWETLLDNCAVLQLFGARNHRLVERFAALAGCKPDLVRSLSPDEQLLLINGDPPRRAWLANYLRDPAYAGMAAANPYFAGKSAGR